MAPYPHWDYFLALEADLSAVARYIEFSPDNFGSYSIELAHIILASSSEVDVVAKVLCTKIDAEFDTKFEKPNIANYRDTIRAHWEHFVHWQVDIPKYGLTFRPWEAWAQSDDNPSWWRDYQDVKHHRDTSFPKANLKNAINSVAGLFCIVLMLYRAANQDRKLYPEPQLLVSSIYKGRNHTDEVLEIISRVESLGRTGGIV